MANDNTLRLYGSVGRNGDNQKGEVVAVAMLLNKFIGTGNLPGVTKLVVNFGTMSPEYENVIRQFQRHIVGLHNPDGRVDPHGKTIQFLNGPVNARGGKSKPEPVTPPVAVTEARRKIAETARHCAKQGGHFLFGARGDMPGRANGHMGRPAYTNPAFYMESSHPRGLGPAVNAAWAITTDVGVIGCMGRPEAMNIHNHLIGRGDKVRLESLGQYMRFIARLKDAAIDSTRWPGFDKFSAAEAKFLSASTRSELDKLTVPPGTPGHFPRRISPNGDLHLGDSCANVRHYDCIGFVNFVLSKVLRADWATNMDWYRNQVDKPGKFTVTKFATGDESTVSSLAEEGDLVLKAADEEDNNHIGICTLRNGTLVVTNCRSMKKGLLDSPLRPEWRFLARLRVI